MSLFKDDIIFHIENPKISTQKLLESVNSVRLQDTRLIFSNLLNFCMCVCAQSLQSCLTLCDHLDCSPPCSSVHRISQAEIVEWVAISFSRGIFPTPGLNSCLLCPLHWQVDSLPPSHLGRTPDPTYGI